jgi:hypothetical protein
VVATLSELSEDALMEILTEPKNALVKQYNKLFGMEGVELEIRPSALKAIAKDNPAKVAARERLANAKLAKEALTSPNSPISEARKLAEAQLLRVKKQAEAVKLQGQIFGEKYPEWETGMKGIHDRMAASSERLEMGVRVLVSNGVITPEQAQKIMNLGSVEILEPMKKVVETKPIAGQKGEWQITAPGKPEGDATEWLKLIQTSCHMLLDLCSNEEDVMHIFKKNKVLFDTVKATDAVFFKEMMGKFTERNNMFTEE